MENPDVSVVDNILKGVLSLYNDASEITVPYAPAYRRYEGISEAVRGFNPETHVIVTKEQLDITNQLKALADLAVTVDQMKEKMNEVHAVQVGKLFAEVEKKQKPKKLTPKQQRELDEEKRKIEVQALRNNADRKALNGL